MEQIRRAIASEYRTWSEFRKAVTTAFNDNQNQLVPRPESMVSWFRTQFNMPDAARAEDVLKAIWANRVNEQGAPMSDSSDDEEIRMPEQAPAPGPVPVPVPALDPFADLNERAAQCLTSLESICARAMRAAQEQTPATFKLEMDLISEVMTDLKALNDRVMKRASRGYIDPMYMRMWEEKMTGALQTVKQRAAACERMWTQGGIDAMRAKELQQQQMDAKANALNMLFATAMSVTNSAPLHPASAQMTSASARARGLVVDFSGSDSE